MDFRARDYFNKLFSEEFEKTLEKRMFNLGVAWGYYTLAECVAKNAGESEHEFLSCWLKEMQNDKAIGQYVKELLALTEKEMTPSERLAQEMKERYNGKI